MNRFKVLLLSSFLTLSVIAFVYSGPQYLAKADSRSNAGHDHAGHDHAGHDHVGHDHKGYDKDSVDNSVSLPMEPKDLSPVLDTEPPLVPRTILENDSPQEESVPAETALPISNLDEQVVRPIELPEIAIRLEYAVEIVRDEIDFEVHCYDRDKLLDAAHMLQNRAQQFRAAIDTGVDSKGLHLEFQRVTDSFLLLAHPLERHHGSILISRSMSRVDQLLWEVNRCLRKHDPQRYPQESNSGQVGKPIHSLCPPQIPNQSEEF